jgi:hypothetical protein
MVIVILVDGINICAWWQVLCEQLETIDFGKYIVVLHLPNCYPSTLANSTLIILFPEMLKISKWFLPN